MSKKQKISYTWDANDYADHSKAQQKWARELLSKLALKGNESLLDIGCGDGKITAEIASYLKTGSVTGIDSSEAMILLARKKYPPDTYPNLVFINQDARNLTFSREFDVVFSNAVLHWVLDHRPILKGIYRSLKPCGRVVVQMGGKGNASRVIDVVNDIIKQAEWAKYFKDFSFPYGFYGPDEYKPWLLEACFSIQSLEIKPKDMIHKNKEEFKGWIRTTWLPYLHRVPVELRERFIDIITEKYLQSNLPDHEGKIHTKMQRLEFIATKLR